MDETTQNQLRFIAIEKRLDALDGAISTIYTLGQRISDTKEKLRLLDIRLNDIKQKADNVDERLKILENLHNQVLIDSLQHPQTHPSTSSYTAVPVLNTKSWYQFW